MKKLPFFILMAALSALHPAAYAETETAKPSTTTETKTGEQPAADAKQADSGEKKADKKGGDEPDCN